MWDSQLDDQPAKLIVWVFVMIVPLAVLFSAALLAISLFAKSFKEAQSYLSPLTMVVIAAGGRRRASRRGAERRPLA